MGIMVDTDVMVVVKTVEECERIMVEVEEMVMVSEWETTSASCQHCLLTVIMFLRFFLYGLPASMFRLLPAIKGSCYRQHGSGMVTPT
ncbi:hypothetical protein Pcinc_034130 [Petrolisthes cinctipes]|uniref:Uncharacterized protein n=1 Tax=Petrolisthes cinctipes TaxID=88211 RepID=A0AAE1JZT0_PETCI|nr:hypothetical protein Pcinc_034130 [Petrolisthes cinctipes]